MGLITNYGLSHFIIKQLGLIKLIVSSLQSKLFWTTFQQCKSPIFRQTFSVLDVEGVFTFSERY